MDMINAYADTEECYLYRKWLQLLQKKDILFGYFKKLIIINNLQKLRCT